MWNESAKECLKNCVCVYVYVCVCAHAHMFSRDWLCDGCMACSPPGSSVHRIFQARILEWVAVSSSKESSPPRNQTCISYTGRRTLYCWEALKDSKSPQSFFWGEGMGEVDFNFCLFWALLIDFSSSQMKEESRRLFSYIWHIPRWKNLFLEFQN